MKKWWINNNLMITYNYKQVFIQSNTIDMYLCQETIFKENIPLALWPPSNKKNNIL